jgi:DNA-binding NarL/FixJ family response regulator
VGPVRRTVLIVDDHAGFRASARALLEADGFDVVAEAADGPDAIAAAARVGPEIVLLDVQLPGLDGFAVADHLATSASAAAIVLISSRDSVARDPRVRRSPALGFIAKSRLSGAALADLVG